MNGIRSWGHTAGVKSLKMGLPHEKEMLQYFLYTNILYSFYLVRQPLKNFQVTGW